MKNLFLLLFLTVIQGCSSGGGDSATNIDSDTTLSIAPGIYTGTAVDPNETTNITGLFTSNGNAYIADIIDTTGGVIGTYKGGSMDGMFYSIPDVYTTSINFTTVTDNQLSGSVDVSTLGSFTFDMFANLGLYNRTASLSKLTGVWVSDLFSNYSYTMTIQQDGTFTLVDTSPDNCNGDGSFSVITPDRNEYAVTMAISNLCASPELAGATMTGTAFISDIYNADDRLNIVVSNQQIALGLIPIKQ